jgi:hypothetical protein
MTNIHIPTPGRSFESAAKSIYMGKVVTNQSHIFKAECEELEEFCHSVQNVLSSLLVSRNVNVLV